MSFQRQAEIRILQHLHTAVHFAWKDQTKDGMFDWVCKNTNISRPRFDVAFESLRSLGYLDEILAIDDTKLSKWKLSNWGLDWVEYYYSFRQVGGGLTYWPTRNGTVMIGTRREKYLNDLAARETDNKIKLRSSRGDTWTRSGVLAGWIGTILTLVGLLITYLVAKH